MKRNAFVVLSVSLLMGLPACKSIPLKDGYYSCDPGVAGSCPSGMTCRWSSEDGEYRCFSGAPADAHVPVCGNGAIDPGEQCDGQSLGGQTCEGLGHPGGTLACSVICTYDRSGCDPVPTCGDGDIDPPAEQCDGSDLGGATCESLGYDAGTLACLDNCTYDTSGCALLSVCGNGQTETGEQCDDGNTDPGDGCGPTCLFEECGNGYPDPGEVCDDGNTTGGDGCSADCLSDETCGNGTLDTAAGEECDDGDLRSHDGCSSCCTVETLDWENVTPAVSPPYRWAFRVAHDMARDRTILFGGKSATTTFHSDTWEFDGSEWTEASPAVSPSDRASPGLAYDNVRNLVVVFGGAYNDGSWHFATGTWEYDGTTWRNTAPPQSPSLRDHLGLAFRSASGNTVLFGAGGGSANDTWLYNGTTWTQATPATSPPGRASPSMAYDTARDRVVLFGGAGDCGSYCADTWEFDGTTWVDVSPLNSPPGRHRGALAFDSSRNRMVLFGGNCGGNKCQDTWEYDGTSWVEIVTNTTPYEYATLSMGYDPLRRRMVLPVCNDTTTQIETWIYHFTSTCADETCDNNADDDSDGLTDCADPDCEGLPCPGGRCDGGACQPCVDNDGDGFGNYCPYGPDCDDNAPGITGPCQANGCPQGWVYIPAGDFEMGCNNGDPCWDGYNDESPRHTVTLSAYCIERTEVSVSAYRACIDWGTCTGSPATSSTNTFCNWSASPASREKHPINCIDQYESLEYCQAWLGGDLPTEAQWEKAARGTDQRTFPWGDSPGADCNHCNFDVNGAADGYGCSSVTIGPGTWEVGSLASGVGDSPYGLKDMAGNVWEWTIDCYSSTFYQSCTSGCTDPQYPCTGNEQGAVRGGSFRYEATSNMRVVDRGSCPPTGQSNVIGLRCIKTP